MHSQVRNMVYCSNCGSLLAADAYFCPKCGTKTDRGKAAKVAYPADELRDAFYQAGAEIERAFTIAAKETHKAILKARDNLQQKTVSPESIVCPKCSTKNPSGSIFCHNCGTKIAPIEESKGSN
jgi:ribosomal protein L40E